MFNQNVNILELEIEKCEKEDYSTLGLIKQIHEMWRAEMTESEFHADRPFDQKSIHLGSITVVGGNKLNIYGDALEILENKKL